MAHSGTYDRVMAAMRRMVPGLIDAQQAELYASSQHTARIEREAQAEPDAKRQVDMSYEMDQ